MPRRTASIAALVLLFGIGACAKDSATPASPPHAADPGPPGEHLVANPESRTTPLAVGDAAPDFTLTDHRGQSFSLASTLESGPVIAIFYRGHW